MSQVSLKEKIGFSMGEYSSSIVWQTLMFFLPIFYTDTYGISAAGVATMFFVVRIFDAFTDPVMGMISDRTNTRWGKFRPYILWLSVPYGLATVLMFTKPDLSSQGKIVFAYITYSLMMVVYTAIMIPYNSLIGVISPRPDVRTSVSSFKFVFAYAAGFSVQLLIIPLVEKLGTGNDAKGYQLTMGIFAIVSIVFLIISFLSVRERVSSVSSEKSNIKQDLTDLIHNRPWIVLFFLSLITLIYVAVRSADIAYYFKYYLYAEEKAGSFMAIGTVFVLLGILPTKYLSLKIGKKKLYIICMLIVSLSSTLFYFAKPQNLFLIYAAQIVFSLASGPTMPLLWSMLADAADYSEWKNRRRATGLVYSAATFAQKAGFSFGGAIVMMVLSGHGFIANQAQTENALAGIKISLSILPAGIAFLGVICLFFYNLDDSGLRIIEQDLSDRRSLAKDD